MSTQSPGGQLQKDVESWEGSTSTSCSAVLGGGCFSQIYLGLWRVLFLV